MTTAVELVRAHFSAGQARAINGEVSSAVSAAGTTQGTATAITAGNNVVTTVAASSGVILPSCEVGDELVVYNDTGTNALTIYPDSGSRINQLAANIGMLLSPYTTVILRRVTSTRWAGFLSA